MARPNTAIPDLKDITSPSLFRTAVSPLLGVIVVHPAEEAELPAVCCQWDDFFNEFEAILLGSVRVAAGFDDPEKALMLLPGTRKTGSLVFSIYKNQGIRDGWGWRDEKASYSFEKVDSRLLLCELPQHEMRSLRATLLKKYYRDQRTVISSETEQASKDLSKILYSTLVPANNREQLSKLEEDLADLSRGYGLLTANHRIIKEGHHRLSDLVIAMEHTLAAIDSENKDLFVNSVMDPLREEADDLEELENDLAEAREGYQAGLEVVRGKVDILLSRESLGLQQKVMEVMEVNNKMQQQSLTFQVAASLIEFVIVAYYGMSLWKYLNEAGFHALPGWAAAILVLLFAGDVTFLTHLIAERIQGHHGLRFKTVAAVLVLIIVVGIMVCSGVIFGGEVHH